MDERETALRIFCALLARDPLPQQRFQEIELRFRLLARLACAAAVKFDEAYTEDDKRIAAAGWDDNAHPKYPDKERPEDPRTKELLANARDSRVPKSQRDLIEQLGAGR